MRFLEGQGYDDPLGMSMFESLDDLMSGEPEEGPGALEESETGGDWGVLGEDGHWDGRELGDGHWEGWVWVLHETQTHREPYEMSPS